MDDGIDRLAEQLRRAAAARDAEPADAAIDDAIPMLTEIVDVDRYDAEELPQSLSQVDWPQLALRVQEHVLERLLGRSDLLLDPQLDATLRALLARATETLAVELQATLRQMIRDLVARAVTDELTRLHAEMTRRDAGPDGA